MLTSSLNNTLLSSPLIVNGQNILINSSFLKTASAISSSSFSGIIDFDKLINYSIAAGAIGSNDILNSIAIVGNFGSGSYSTSILYRVEYDTIVYLDPGYLGTNFSIYPFYFELTESLGE
jgi:hypothetical protein